MEKYARMSRCWVVGWALCLMAVAGVRAADLSVKAQVRWRAEERDDRDFNSLANDRRGMILQRARIGLQYRPTDDWELGVTLQDSRTFDPFGSPGTQAETEFQEAWVKYSGLLRGRLSVTVGRLPLNYGNQRLIGPFEWSNVARRFDAIKLGWDLGPVTLDAWVSELGNSPSTFAANGEFWGLYATWPDLLGAKTETYALWTHDPSILTNNVVTLGGRRSARLGAWHYDLEGAAQVGDATAYAAALEGGGRAGRYDFVVGYNVASGDPTPGAGGGGSHTFQNLFPTNHLHYGYLDYQGWRNVHNVYFTTKARLDKGISGQVQYNAFWLNDKRDFWYGAGGGPNLTTGGVPFRDPTGASGSEIGQELDVVVSLEANQWVGFQVGYGHFWPGAFIRAINRANGSVTRGSDFMYFQVLSHY